MGWRWGSRKMRQNLFRQNARLLLQEKLRRSGRRSPNVANIYSLTDLQKATNNFHATMIIGKGGSGTLYKGLLADNKPVAIKKNRTVDTLINEVLALSRFMNHRNIVKLIGYCLETQVPLAVFEFISNGTLFDNLYVGHSLGWDVRLKIATETADVLSYIHATGIIHGDVKSNNILIDIDFTAKLSDFGASIPADLDELSTMVLEATKDDELNTTVMGTLGYLDPEYMQTSKLTEKSDVYSFGVVLVELLTRMKAFRFNCLAEERNLANLFLLRLEEERLFEIVDETIVSDGNREQLTQYSKLAQVCLNVKGENRPSMKEVAVVLEGLRSGRQQHSWPMGLS